MLKNSHHRDTEAQRKPKIRIFYHIENISNYLILLSKFTPQILLFSVPQCLCGKVLNQ
jgi:hypothetical protein